MNVSFEFALKFERFRRKNCVLFSPLLFLYLKFILSILKLNLTHSPLFVFKFAATVPNMSSYQYLNNRNEWMAAFIVAESYENIHKFSQILAMNLFTKVKLYLFLFCFSGEFKYISGEFVSFSGEIVKN